MWLRVPEAIEKVLWEGSLEPSSGEAVERLRGEWTRLGVQGDTRDVVRALPVVTIGQPEVWPLPQVYPSDKMDPLLRSKLEEADFYLVRFACSFRTRRQGIEVEWARFLVRLLPGRDGRQPIAFDLHPQEVVQEAKRDVRVTIGPSLKFQEVEGSLGSVAFGIEYPELQPIISAAGVGEALPSWDYVEAKGTTVRGLKWMHLLLKAPKGAEEILAQLDLAADVRAYKGLLRVFAIPSKEKAEAHLTVRLV